jgi:nucleotide-binding universal stress UspA family protein
VPVDESAASRRALGEAIRICSFTKARIFLLHVIEDIDELETYHPVRLLRAMRWRDDGRAALLKAEVAVQRYSIPVHSILRPAEGQPLHRAIVASVEAAQTDLVVMGSRGGLAIGPVRFSSLAQKVVNLCPVPVLVLRAK